MSIRTLAIAVLSLISHAASAAETGRWTYDADQLRPFWQSDTMRGESVLFVREDGGDASVGLLFEPTKILSVTNAAGDVTYVEGKDYVWDASAHRLKLPAGSSVVCKKPQDLIRQPGSQMFKLTRRDGNGEVLFGATHEYQDMQTLVTYTHKEPWAGPRTAFAGAQLPHTFAKLSAKEPLTVGLIGDSISTGCNASGWAKVPPFQPAWQDLFVMQLEKTYGGKVNLHNFAVGGTGSKWGLENIAKVADVKPDLVLLAFGMNDTGGVAAEQYQANIRGMIEAVRKTQPNAEFILVSPMHGNAEWVAIKSERFPQYRDALSALCGPGVALADLTSMWDEFYKRKKDRDLTGNGVNHPNDFGHRVYAQVLSALLVQPDPLAGHGR